MQVFVNDKVLDCQQSITLAEALKTAGIQTENVAVAVDYAVVPKQEWETTVLEDKCNIIVIRASHGG